MSEAIPTVEGLLTPDSVQIVIPCPYCESWHRHGAIRPEIGAGDGHRTSHCDDEAVKPNAGYILKTIGRASEQAMRRIRLKRTSSRPKTAREALSIS